MKKLYLYLTLLLGLLGGAASAQTGAIDIFFSDSVYTPNSTTVCSGTNYSVWTGAWFSTMPTAGGTGQIDIDWGDGNSTSQTITFSGSPGQVAYTPNLFNHTYAAGSFVATFIYSDVAGNDDTIYWNVNATPYCGTVYTNVMLDQDGNGTGDIVLNNSQVDFTDGASNTTTYTLSGSSGINGVDVSAAPYTVTVNPSWMAANNYINVQPPSQVVNFTGSPYVQLPGFVVQCDPNAPVSQVDLAINYFYGWGFRAGLSTGYVTISICNLTCSGSANANLALTFDPLLTVSSHNIPGGTVTGNTINASIGTAGCQNYTVYFSVPGPTPAGTPLAFSANVSPVGATDYNLANNSATLASEVRNSWDPNDKSTNRPQVVSPSVQDEFTYMIRFQNMGNDDAFNIVVKDTLDADLDLSTFGLLELSHSGSVNIDPVTRIATFNFPNINLPAASVNEPASHGYAIYKIKENAGNGIGTAITNTAYIYFDFNPPIITNTTFNVNQTSGVAEVGVDAFAVYPVPASEFVTISSKNNAALGSVKVVDVTGKTVFAASTQQSIYQLDVKTFANGVYTLLLENGAAASQHKIIIGK